MTTLLNNRNGQTYIPFSPPGPCKGIQDILRFWIPQTGFRIVCQWNLNSRFQSLVRYPDSLSCIRDSKAGDSGFDNSNCLVSGFHKQNFPGFPYLGRNRCSLTLHASWYLPHLNYFHTDEFIFIRIIQLTDSFGPVKLRTSERLPQGENL